VRQIDIFERITKPFPISVVSARNKVISAATRLRPAILTDLETQAFTIRQIESNFVDNFVAEWALRHNLEEWCRNWAADRLRHFQAKSLGLPLLIIGIQTTSLPLSVKRFELVGWDPENESGAEFRRRLQGAGDAYMKETLTRIEGRLVPCLQVGPPHFFWLAGFQVLEWSRKAIARANRVLRTKGSDAAAISRGIKSLADFIDLTLRPDGINDVKQTAEQIAEALDQLG
jgi:hypothetical protein